MAGARRGAFALRRLRPSIYERYAYGKEYDTRRHEYIIGPADVVHISVYHMNDLSGGGTVRSDGVPTMPPVGDLHVAGKTPSQVRGEMKRSSPVTWRPTPRSTSR